MTLFELTEQLTNFNIDEKIVTAYITISQKSFQKEYSWESRTYLFSSTEDRFNPEVSSDTFFANSVDGSDVNINLADYIYRCPFWEVEDYGIVNFQLIKNFDNDLTNILNFSTKEDAFNKMFEEFSEIYKEENNQILQIEDIENFQSDYDYGITENTAYALSEGEQISWIIIQNYISDNMIVKTFPEFKKK